MIHAAKLWHGLVALVEEHQSVLREVVEQGRRRFTGQAAGKVPGIVFDAVAIAHLLHNLEVKHGALAEPLGFEQLTLLPELAEPPLELIQDTLKGPLALVGGHHVVRPGVNRQPVVSPLDLAKERVDLAEGLDLLAPHCDPVSVILIGGEDFDHVAAHPEVSTPEVDVVALVLDLDQPAQDVLAADLLPFLEQEQHPVIGFGRAKAVNATDARDNQAVAAFEKRAGGGHAQLVQLVVDRRLFLDINVACGNVSLRLIIIVVADEVLHRVVGEEVAELVVELRGQGLVMGQHQSGPVHGLDHLGHGESLARARHSEQHLVLLAVLHSAKELLDCHGLVTAGLVVGTQLKVHGPTVYFVPIGQVSNQVSNYGGRLLAIIATTPNPWPVRAKIAEVQPGHALDVWRSDEES